MDADRKGFSYPSLSLQVSGSRKIGARERERERWITQPINPLKVSMAIKCSPIAAFPPALGRVIDKGITKVPKGYPNTTNTESSCFYAREVRVP